MAEGVMGLFKAELVCWDGPWRGLDDLELATWAGSTGSTTAGCTQPWTTGPPPRSKQSIIFTNTTGPSVRSRQN